MKVGETIYADYQASTPIDPRVRAVMLEAENTLFANPHSADHLLGWQSAAAVEAAAHSIASFFGLLADEVIFTSGASEANTMAIRAAENIAKKGEAGRLLLGAGDHKSILEEAERSGLQVELIPLDSNGAPDLVYLENQLETDVCMVSLIAVNNENGAILDVDRVATICAERGVALHLDLAQAPCAIELNLFDLGVAFATLSSHKIYGPKGIGALLVAGDMNQFLQPLILGGGQQNGRRGGTQPTPLCVGFSEAVRILDEQGDEDRVRIAALRDRFVAGIRGTGFGELIGSVMGRHPGNALIRFPGWEAADLLARMQPLVAAASQSACSSGEIQVSHVLSAMGLDDAEAKESVRFSFGRFTDSRQIDKIIDVIESVIGTP